MNEIRKTREIKFRAWDGEKMWDNSTGALKYAWLGRGICAELVSGVLTPFKSNKGTAVLMQFTGLKDKNGKEIYEWDIVKVKKFDMLKSITAEVLWSFDNAGFKLYTEEGNDDIYDMVSTEMDGTEYEVIGNTYENPELIKQ